MDRNGLKLIKNYKLGKNVPESWDTVVVGEELRREAGDEEPEDEDGEGEVGGEDEEDEDEELGGENLEVWGEDEDDEEELGGENLEVGGEDEELGGENLRVFFEALVRPKEGNARVAISLLSCLRSWNKKK